MQDFHLDDYLHGLNVIFPVLHDQSLVIMWNGHEIIEEVVSIKHDMPIAMKLCSSSDPREQAAFWYYLVRSHLKHNKKFRDECVTPRRIIIPRGYTFVFHSYVPHCGDIHPKHIPQLACALPPAAKSKPALRVHFYITGPTHWKLEYRVNEHTVDLKMRASLYPTLSYFKHTKKGV